MESQTLADVVKNDTLASHIFNAIGIYENKAGSNYLARWYYLKDLAEHVVPTAMNNSASFWPIFPNCPYSFETQVEKVCRRMLSNGGKAKHQVHDV